MSTEPDNVEVLPVNLTVHSAPAPAEEVEDEDKLYRLMVATDVAHEKLLLWRVAAVVMAIVTLVLLRVMFVPWEVPWR